MCVIYDENKYPDIKNLKKRKEKPFFIDINKIENITQKDFYDFFLPDVTEFCAKNNLQLNFQLEKDVYSSPTILFDSFVSVVLPAFLRKGNNQIMQSQIVKSNIIMQNILKLDKKSKEEIDCIFSTLPQYPSYYIEDSFAKQIKNNSRLRKELKTVYKQMDYESFCPEDTDIYNKRFNEVELYITFMKLVFENYMCPLIQIQTGINFSANIFLQALNRTKNEKIPKVYNQFLTEINRYAVKEYLDFIPNNKIPRIKIYSDAPVEFFVNNEYHLPILISTNLCKVPMTPGTDFINQVSLLNETYITYKELSNILIIRSFKSDDNIKYVLEEKLKTQKGIENLNLTFKDVKNSKELIDTLNHSSDYKIVIFDCHGKHSSNDLSGLLQLEEDDFDIWKERAGIECMPPIVLFSACQTNVYGNTMYSTASGFFAAGAKTILATTTSVEAISSAEFMVRLLLKIAVLRNFLCEEFHELTFLDLVSNVFRVSFITDILSTLKIEETYRKKIIEVVSIYINRESSMWYDFFIEQMGIQLGKSHKDILNIINNKIGYCESLKYILLGNADKIKVILK